MLPSLSVLSVSSTALEGDLVPFFQEKVNCNFWGKGKKKHQFITKFEEVCMFLGRQLGMSFVLGLAEKHS